MSPNFDGIIPALIVFGLIIGLMLWGAWELIDMWFIDHSFKSSVPIIPDIEINIKNGVADTTYIYKKPVK